MPLLSLASSTPLTVFDHSPHDEASILRPQKNEKRSIPALHQQEVLPVVHQDSHGSLATITGGRSSSFLDISSSNSRSNDRHPYSSFLENGNGALELAARTERVLFPSTSLSAGMGVQTLALNWWLTPYWRIQTGWDHLQPVGGEGVQAWTIRFACDW